MFNFMMRLRNAQLDLSIPVLKPTMTNFRVENSDKDKVYFDAPLGSVDGIDHTKFTISGKSISGVNTTLNFDPEYLALGVDWVDNLLFFTDNNNPPRFINIERNYANPTIVGFNFVDQFTAEALLVIKRPPYTAPLIVPTSGGQNNYLEDRFVCFG